MRSKLLKVVLGCGFAAALVCAGDGVRLPCDIDGERAADGSVAAGDHARYASDGAVATGGGDRLELTSVHD